MSDADAVDETVDADPAVGTEREPTEVEQSEITAAQEKAGGPQLIPVGLIVKSEIALRDADTSSESFQLLLNSIKKKGVLNSILVREIEEDGVKKYGLIDGLQRYTCAQAAGMHEIPANVVEMDDAELLEAQIITNMNRVITKPAELSRHLLRILSRNPLMTKADLATRCCQSKTWIEQRLSLNKLDEQIQELVDQGQIHLTNAYALSKLPTEEQTEHVDAAMTEAPKLFVPRMNDRAKEIRDAKNKGRDAGPAVFKPQQHLQKIADVKSEFAAIVEGEGDSQLLEVLTNEGVTITDDIKEAVGLALAWALHFDTASKEAQETKYAEKKEKEKEAKELRKKEREAAREKAAAEAKQSILNI
jgi:ParB family chromosome partitioning protein